MIASARPGGWIVAILVVAGCLHEATVHCPGGGICPAGLVCGAIGDREICVAATCGNNHIDPGEACDDGNTISGDGCPADCGPPCGDGVVDPGEVCDDGNTTPGDHCAADCRSIEQCGDGIRDPGEACDDADLQSGDGCSSRCSVEAPAWTTIGATPAAAVSVMAYDAARGTTVLFGAPSNTWEWDGVGWQRRVPANTPPISTQLAEMVYDATRQRVLLLGGFGSSLENVWEWDGSDWRTRVASRMPPAMAGYGIAYDTARQRVVLFGGGTDIVFDRTWEWDGASWQEIVTPTRPAARAALAMAYDARRGKVVLYGGADTQGIFFDTWEYDGRTWSQRAISGPPRSYYPRMVFDAAREKVVLFGGIGNDDVDPSTAYTWEWDGSQWTEVAGLVEPSPRLRVAMAYDLVRRHILLFGGQLRIDLLSPSLNDTWTRAGSTWIAHQDGPTVDPPPRSRHAMVYADRTTATTLFGGRDAAGTCLGDTWQWSGSGWHEITVEGSPAPRAEHAMAYDAAHDRAVLFGGVGATGQALDDTWEWDGAAWAARAVTPHPPARKGHAMVYDAAHEQVLVIGGTTAGPLVDQWAWDGAGWSEVVPAVRPPRRSDFAATYDAARGRVVVFGGLGASGALRDVWEWDGVQWTERTPPAASGPAARSGHALVYDTALRRVVLFGGHSDAATLDDAWTWDGQRWTRLAPATVPAARHHHAMVSDAARRVVMSFGGDNSSGPIGDLWLFRYGDPSVHREDCATGFDGDGDGKTGCADPDCDALCASCGDGVCSAFESCGLCPADCGACQVCGDLHCDAGETCASCPGDCGSCP